MLKAEDIWYEKVMIDGIQGLFTNGRIDRNSVPKNLFCYDVRHDDLCRGIASEIKPFIMVNHWETLLTKQEIPLEGGSYYPKEDMNYLECSKRLKEFLEEPFLPKEETEEIQKMQIKM